MGTLTFMALFPKAKAKAETQEGKCTGSAGTSAYTDRSMPGLFIAKPEHLF